MTVSHSTISKSLAIFFAAFIAAMTNECGGGGGGGATTSLVGHLVDTSGLASTSGSADEILEQYPSLDADDIRACLRFATAVMSQRYDLEKVA
jgi:hypothetical protein